MVLNDEVGLIKWYSTPSPNLSPYIFLGLDPSPPPLASRVSQVCGTYQPLMEEIRLKIFGSPDYPIFLDSPLSDGDSVYSTETLFEISGTPNNTYA